MKLGYIRVSTKEQHVDRQIDELKKYGIEDRHLFIDTVSGASMNRKHYEALKAFARAGDIIYFHELDRLGRNKIEILNELKYFKEQDITIRILDVPTTMIDFDGYGDASKSILDMINNVMIEVLSTLAEHELEKIHKRQQEGILAAKKRGIKFGRKPIELPDSFVEQYTNWKSGQCTAVETMRKLNLKKTTFYKLVKEYEKGAV